jgi:hypothetical protein
MQPVIIHTNVWLAFFFLVFQLICNGKEYWQLKQDQFQQYLAFNSNLPEVLKILLYSFELLRSNHGETDSLCRMFNTTPIQFPTCVVILQQKMIPYLKVSCCVHAMPLLAGQSPKCITGWVLVIALLVGRSSGHGIPWVLLLAIASVYGYWNLQLFLALFSWYWPVTLDKEVVLGYLIWNIHMSRVVECSELRLQPKQNMLIIFQRTQLQEYGIFSTSLSTDLTYGMSSLQYSHCHIFRLYAATTDVFLASLILLLLPKHLQLPWAPGVSQIALEAIATCLWLIIHALLPWLKIAI